LLFIVKLKLRLINNEYKKFYKFFLIKKLLFAEYIFSITNCNVLDYVKIYLRKGDKMKILPKPKKVSTNSFTIKDKGNLIRIKQPSIIELSILHKAIMANKQIIRSIFHKNFREKHF